MALFNRRNKDTVLPEVEQYYQAERRDRTGLAWLLALVSMVIVAGLLVGIFLAGRWAYNKLADNNGEDVATTETTDAPSFDGTPSENTDEKGQESDETSTEDAQQPAGTPSTSDTTSQAENTGNTSSTSTNLPSTGPGDVIAIFTGVSAVAGGAHYVVQRRKLNR